jgi:pimeloyl-ACP methyl ester carboxylesterase
MQLFWRALGLLFLLAALALPLARVPDQPVESLVARWAQPPSEFISVKGQLVHVRDEGPRGDNSPILLIHGTSSSLHTWEGWAKAIKPYRRVISFDLPGFGLTGPFDGQYPRDDYRGDTLAGFVIDLMDQLKVKHAVLVGNSLGGEVAWRVASLAPHRVDKLVLIDASGYRFTPLNTPLGFKLARLPVLGWLSEYVLPRAAVQASLRSVYADPRKITPDLVDLYHDLTLRQGNRHTLRLRLGVIENDLAPERVALLRLPTLVMWGAMDKLIPPDNAQHFLQDIPGSKLVLFDNLAHVPQEEDPEQSLNAARAFLGLPPPVR